MASRPHPSPNVDRQLDVSRSGRIPAGGKSARRIFSALVSAALGCVWAAIPPLPAHALTGAEIMMRTFQARAQGDNASSTLRVELRSKNGATVTQTVETYRKDCDGSLRQLVVMREPADIAGAAFLTWIHPDRYPDMWLYLPELGRLRQLNPATRGESFMGSDFTYEDLGAPARDERTHAIVGEPLLDGEPTYEVESVPRARDVYSRIRTWVSRETFLPRRVEYFDPNGELLKVGRFDDVRVVKGIPTVFALAMENVRTGHRTAVTLLEADFDRPFDCALFTERGLTRGVR
jgi:Outer membrane lipoprotein-sorting protein